MIERHRAPDVVPQRCRVRPVAAHCLERCRGDWRSAAFQLAPPSVVISTLAIAPRPLHASRVAFSWRDRGPYELTVAPGERRTVAARVNDFRRTVCEI